MPPSPEEALVYVYLNSERGFWTSIDLVLDGEEIGKVHTLGYAVLRLEPGEHTFRGRGEHTRGLLWQEPEKTSPMIREYFEPGETYYIRYSVRDTTQFSSLGSFDVVFQRYLELVDPVEAEWELAFCRRAEMKIEESEPRG